MAVDYMKRAENDYASMFGNPRRGEFSYEDIERVGTPDELIVNVPAGVRIAPEANRQFREVAFKAGMTREQVQALMDYDCSRTR